MSTRARSTAPPGAIARALEPVHTRHVLAIVGASAAWLTWLYGLVAGTPWGACLTAGALWTVMATTDGLEMTGAVTARTSGLLRSAGLGAWLLVSPRAIAAPTEVLAAGCSVVLVALFAHRAATMLSPHPRSADERRIRDDLRLAAGLAGCAVLASALVILFAWQFGWNIGPEFFVQAILVSVGCLAPTVVTVRMVLHDAG